MKRKREPRYLRSGKNGAGRFALPLFLVAAVACEAVLVRAARGSQHPVLLWGVVAVMGLVFAAFAFAIRYLLNASRRPAGKEVPEEEEKRKITVAAAVIRRGDAILATQRGYGAYRGWWEFPGGKLEAWETPKEACRREIREELATDVEVGEELAVVFFDYPEFRLELHCFLCTLVGEAPKLLEHDAARWLRQEELDSVRWLEADLEVIEKLKTLLP